MFFFGDYEGLRVRQALPQLSTVPTPAEVGGDFSAFLQLSNPNPGVLDCSGNPTYQGEIFNPILAQSNSAFNGGPCSAPIGTTSAGVPTNKFQGNSGTNTAIDPLAQELANLFPAPNVNISTLQTAGNYLSEPKRSETENKFDVRVDQTLSGKDNFFARYSYGNDSNFLPSPFNNVLDGGSFQDGYSKNTAQGLAASELHAFRNNLVNEFRFGFNYLNSHRYNLYSNENVSAQLPIPFPGVPFEAGQNIGGLPYIGFGDGTTGIGASEFLPADEKQHSYVFTDNLSWTRGRHAVKFGAELRFEQFTMLEPAEARGAMGFGDNFLINDNLADPGTGGEAFASFMQGISDGGEITSVTPNVIYNRQIYAVYALDDFKVTPKLTLNLGLRYEIFTTIKEANNNQANFDFNPISLIVPSGQKTQLTPTLGSLSSPFRTTVRAGSSLPTSTISRPALDWLTNFPTSSSSAAAMASSMAGRKTAHSPTRAPASILRSCLRRHSTTNCTAPSANPRLISRIARSRPRTTAACRSTSCRRAFPPPRSATRTHPSSTRSIRIW
jgi:hypothetical protein